MIPNYHPTDALFWWAMFALALGLLYLLVQLWISKFKDLKVKQALAVVQNELPIEKVLRHFAPLTFVTIMCLVAMVMIVVGQGSKAVLENSTMAPVQETNPAFTKAYEDTQKELTPNTQQSLEEARIKAEALQKAEEIEASAIQRQQIGTDMADFRQRILNREQPGANSAPATPHP